MPKPKKVRAWKPKKVRRWVDHGGFSHAGRQTWNCYACRLGIGTAVRKLEPMK